MTKDQLMVLLDKYHLRPTKAFGQHYLIDENVLAATIEAADIKDGELVVEIGAGPGALTAALAKAGADVLAVEYDRNFAKLLQEEYHNWRNVHVLCDDALRLNFSELIKNETPYKKIVANIPYQITNPLVRKILEPGSTIEVAVLLIQKEVAERLTAAPGSSDRGILTLMVERYGKIEKVIEVPPEAFWPAPSVDSTVIKITRNAEAIESPDADAALFWFIKQGFSGKRKVLSNSLSGGLQLPKSAVADMIEKAGLDLNWRAEDLSLENWIALFELYQKQLDHKE